MEASPAATVAPMATAAPTAMVAARPPAAARLPTATSRSSCARSPWCSCCCAAAARDASEPAADDDRVTRDRDRDGSRPIAPRDIPDDPAGHQGRPDAEPDGADPP